MCRFYLDAISMLNNLISKPHHYTAPKVREKQGLIDQFRYIKIQPQTVDLSTRLWGISTEFVGFIPQRLALRSIV